MWVFVIARSRRERVARRATTSTRTSSRPSRPRQPGPLRLVLASLLAAVGCSGNTLPSAVDTAPVTGDRCVVWLHGKGEAGRDTRRSEDGIVEIAPSGNVEDGSGRRWEYFPPDRFDDIVDDIIGDVQRSRCRDVVVSGFSNGGGLAGKLFCSGRDLGGTLRGVVIDDPVPDRGVEGCAPAPGVEVAVYWTGALSEAVAGVDCSTIGWICDGGSLLGIDAYAEHVGADIQSSPSTDHTWFRDAPELRAWLDREQRGSS